MEKSTPVIWITWDEAHKDTLGIYGAGTHETPGVDGLAACSHTYMNARTCSPVCLPARCSMATGLMPHNTCCLSNSTGGALRASTPSVFSMMHAHDYHTSLFGKCHFMPVPYAITSLKRTLDYEPTLAYYRSLGIDTLVVEDGKCCSTWFYDDYAKALSAAGLLNDYRRELADKEKDRVFAFPGPESMQPDRWVADQAIRYIRNAEGANEFIWVSFAGPHYPQDPPQRCMDKVDLSKLPKRKTREGEWDDPTKLHRQSYYGPGITEGSARVKDGAQCNFSQEYWDRWQKGYRGNVVMLDECVNDLLDAVREKWGNDALIIFTADHGDMSGHHGIWAKNSSVYEDVLQIPLIIHLPGQTEAVYHEEIAGNLDLLPTTMEKVFGEHISCDGRDATDTSGSPATVFSEKDNQVAVLQDGCKLSRTFFKGKEYCELYDLNRDPDEFENVYGHPEYAQIRKKLEAAMESDPVRMKRVFYKEESGEEPYWMAPMQKGIPVYPGEE